MQRQSRRVYRNVTRAENVEYNVYGLCAVADHLRQLHKALRKLI
jgi:hypothetical protein